VSQISSAFPTLLLTWYERNKRDLPWRDSSDAYKIWLSEIILQQTRVAQGMPYYLKFVERFPNVSSMAAASQEEVLSLWQGLGYYSRARNMHECAQYLVNELGGEFPSTCTELLKLKGVGAYTAAAIASFAFGEAVPVVDGNVFRVASRVFGIYTDISGSKARADFEKVLVKLIPPDSPGLFNQAMMEFGALHCTHDKPDCEGCVFKEICQAYLRGEVKNLPVKTKKVGVKNRHLNYFVFQCGDLFVFRERKERDIWLGLHDFPSVEGDRLLDEEEALDNAEKLFGGRSWSLANVSEPYRHILTHRVIYARFFHIEVSNEAALLHFAQLMKLKLVKMSVIDNVSKPVLIKNYLINLFFLLNSKQKNLFTTK